MPYAGGNAFTALGRGLRGIGSRIGEKRREDEIGAERERLRLAAEAKADARHRDNILSTPGFYEAPEVTARTIEPPPLLDTSLPPSPFAQPSGRIGVSLPPPDLDVPDFRESFSVPERAPLPEGHVRMASAPDIAYNPLHNVKVPEPNRFSIHGYKTDDPDEAVGLHKRFSAAGRDPNTGAESPAQTRLAANDARDTQLSRLRGQAEMVARDGAKVDSKNLSMILRGNFPQASPQDVATVVAEVLTGRDRANQLTDSSERTARTARRREMVGAYGDPLSPTEVAVLDRLASGEDPRAIVTSIAASGVGPEEVQRARDYLQLPDEPEPSGGVLGGGAPAVAAPAPASTPAPVPGPRATAPAAAPVAAPEPRRERAFTQAAPTPAKPAADRIAELKAEGKSKEEARRIMESEGYRF